MLEAPAGQTVTSGPAAAKVASTVARLQKLNGVVSATDPLDSKAPAVSADKRAAYSTVTYGVQPPEITYPQRAALIGTVQAARDAGPTAEVAGQASVPPTEVGGAAELVGVAAALFSVFAGFVVPGDATIKPIASALALGILVDAVVVRMVIMPSALALLGARAWWLPRWLAWLPRVDVEGLALDRPAPEPEREPVSS